MGYRGRPVTGLRADGGSLRFQKGTGEDLVGVPGRHLAAVCPEPVHVVTATRPGGEPVTREFTDLWAAKAWALVLTELGWVIRRETKEQT